MANELPKPKYLQEVEQAKQKLEHALNNGHAELKPQIEELKKLDWRKLGSITYAARLPNDEKAQKASALITQLRDLGALPVDRQVDHKDITGVNGDVLRFNAHQMEILGIKKPEIAPSLF